MCHDELPNKCFSCGLKQVFPVESDQLFRDLRTLFDKGIIKQKFIRNLYMGDGKDRAEFCLISHSAWGLNNTHKKCDKWQLDVGLPKSDVLGINLTVEMKNMSKTANRIAVLAVCIAFLPIAILLGQTLEKLLSK
jgi:hypothetical protein